MLPSCFLSFAIWSVLLKINLLTLRDQPKKSWEETLRGNWVLIKGTFLIPKK